ncbi:MAG: nucleotidyltransferase domain-containing protein [Bacteroidaceae bacterium]|nr:nucleotidyltransferase domain-containing protein [Bacteroidaceae bacterium]
MTSTSSYLNKIRLYYHQTAAAYGVRRMAVFGSVARGEQTETSDVDILYEGEPNILLRSRMKQELEILLGVPVDVVRMRKSLTDSFFLNNIKNDLIYV